MTVEFVDFKAEITVEKAFEKIRRVGPQSVTIYTCYVTDTTRHLKGVVTAEKLMLAHPGDIIGNIMDVDYVYANTTDDQESVVHLFEKYGIITLPVVDSEKRLVGIITVDDIMDVMQEEATEDFELMAAMRPSEKPYLKTSVFSLSRNRIFWLLFLMVSAIITGTIISVYEDTIAAIPLLVAFIPMLMDTGGNAGAQSSTMIIRGMALQELKTSDYPKVFLKELSVSLVCGTVLSAFTFIWLSLQHPGNIGISVTVCLTLVLTVVCAKSLGGLLPVIAKKINVDPAVMAAPLITTIVDAFSLFIYFQIAVRLFRLV